MSTPITEDWRKTTRSVEGLQTKNRCINYKEVYNEMKHGTISDRNLVGILEYFKMKAKEDIGMICRDEPIISSGHKILEVEHDEFGQYLMPNIIKQGSLFTSPIEPLDRNMDIQGQGVVRQIFQEEMCQNNLNEERQDEGEMKSHMDMNENNYLNEQRECEEGRKSPDKENKEKDQETITEHKEMSKVSKIENGKNKVKTKIGNEKNEDEMKIGNEKNEGEMKSDESDKKTENEMERVDIDLALQDIGLQVIKEETKDDVTIFVDNSRTGGSACDEVSESESQKSNLEELEEELCVPDKNVDSQWSLLEDIEDTLVKTVAGKTEDIYKDDEEEDDPMEYECYDESDRLYFMSERKSLIKLQELRKEAEKIAKNISVKKFYGNRKNNSDDNNMFKGWMDRAVHKIEMVHRRCSSDDFDVKYSIVMYRLKNKDDVEGKSNRDSAEVHNESKNAGSKESCEGSEVEKSGEENAMETGNESDRKDENRNEKDIKENEKNENSDGKNEKDEKRDGKDEKSDETEDTIEAANVLLLFQKGSIR